MKLSRIQRIALGIIVLAIVVANIGIFLYRESPKKASAPEGLPPSLKTKPADAPQAGARPFPFDPNTADSASFVALGLRPGTARAIIHYRRAGGRFREPDDFSRIYTLSRQDFARLRPYIRISPRYSIQDSGRPPLAHYQTPPSPRPKADSQYPHSETRYIRKLKPGERVCLSTADTTDLERIPGIGPYYAAKIIRYRERMGGFVSADQLKEIYGLPDDICRWVSVGNPEINKLRINSMTFGQLLRHPYLNFEQVRAILNHRQLYGPLRSLQDLHTYQAFSEADLQRLSPYVAFE